MFCFCFWMYTHNPIKMHQRSEIMFWRSRIFKWPDHFWIYPLKWSFWYQMKASSYQRRCSYQPSKIVRAIDVAFKSYKRKFNSESSERVVLVLTHSIQVIHYIFRVYHHLKATLIWTREDESNKENTCTQHLRWVTSVDIHH